MNVQAGVFSKYIAIQACEREVAEKFPLPFHKPSFLERPFSYISVVFLYVITKIQVDESMTSHNL